MYEERALWRENQTKLIKIEITKLARILTPVSYRNFIILETNLIHSTQNQTLQLLSTSVHSCDAVHYDVYGASYF